MESEKKELKDIFRDIENKDERAFEELYTKYNKLVYSIAFSVLKNKEDSENIVQIVFEKVWKMNKEKLPNKNELNWLYTVSKNEAINYLKTIKHELDFDDVYYIENDNNEINEIIEKDRFNKIIAKLNKQEQEIVTLRIISDFSFKEISKMLGIPIGTVQWKYYKSLNTLKMLLSNILMFCISMTVFVKRQIIKEKEDDKKGTVQDNKDLQKEEMSLANDVSKQEDSMMSNKINENILSDDNRETIEMIEKNATEKIKLNEIDIGILSISGVFLFFILFFSIIFIKHQQKLRKKLSK